MLSNFRKSLSLAAALLMLIAAVPAQAVITLAQAAVSNTRSGGSATSATLTITLTSPVAAGHSVAVAWGTGGGTQVQSLTSITDDKANAYNVTQNNVTGIFTSQSGVAVLLNVANTPQTITITAGAGVADNIGITATVYDVAGDGALDVSTHNNSGSSTALLVSFSTVAASEFALVSLVNNNSAATYTQNNGWTQDTTSGFTSLYTFHNILTGAGSNSLNATASVAVFSLWSVVTLQPAGGAAVQSKLSLMGVGASLLAPSPPDRDPVDCRRRSQTSRLT